MQHLQHDITIQLDSDDEDERADAQDMQDAYDLLLRLIPQLFPRHSNAETISLFYHDLSASIILVNDQGNLVGIVDWECTITAPSWLVCEIPAFLEGLRRALASVPDLLSAEHQEYEYEVAQLRSFFLEGMARVKPEWVKEYREASV
ncbi:hypothetical protein EK21DRAFT_107651 [Setomelanomma holmii]|uniref:Aminoglycoside phosphotransferase domain-containing protein n=1 Tax=Setomelanomma holmii TaxID=210430 RepID=A0A9P4HH10_9PLEO|nr:hypothetical protein EK21DRAFT_107651 [Setomelanomma holmii]